MTDSGLLPGFVAAFPQGHKPEPHMRDAAALEAFYAALPEGLGRLPKLYETFMLSYKWGTGQFGSSRMRIGSGPGEEIVFLANRGGDTFESQIQAVKSDRIMWEILSANGYYPFATGGRWEYDVVCFALKSGREGDCPVVGIKHEEILCNNRIRIAMRVAPSFRSLVESACWHRKAMEKMR